MPSVDSVGRYFPLTIAAPVDPKLNLLSISSVSQEWYTQLERLARSCLDDDFDLNRFDAEIKQLAQPVGYPAPSRREDETRSEARLANAWRYGMASPDQLSFDCPSLLHEMLDRLLYSYSLWWTRGSTRVTPTYLVCQGLPPPQGYAAMLDGNWQKWGWEDRQFLDPHNVVDRMGQDSG